MRSNKRYLMHWMTCLRKESPLKQYVGQFSNTKFWQTRLSCRRWDGYCKGILKAVHKEIGHSWLLVQSRWNEWMLHRHHCISSFLLINFGHLVKDLVTYVWGLGSTPTTDGSDDVTHAMILMQTIEDLLGVANCQPLHKVRKTICRENSMIGLPWHRFYSICIQTCRWLGKQCWLWYWLTWSSLKFFCCWD